MDRMRQDDDYDWVDDDNLGYDETMRLFAQLKPLQVLVPTFDTPPATSAAGVATTLVRNLYGKQQPTGTRFA